MLTKKSRTGRCTQYKFYLFTDSLMYATVNPRKSSVKVHQILDFGPEFRLSSEPPTTTGKVHQHSFHIDHPVKNFVLIASSSTVKQNWVRHIQDSLKIFRRQNRDVTSEKGSEPATTS